MKRTRPELWIIALLCSFGGGCTVHDRVTADGRHVRAVSVGRGGPKHEYETSRPETPNEIGARPLTPEEFARNLADDHFAFRSAHQDASTHDLRFDYDRKITAADQYEFVKKVAQAGSDREFPRASFATVSVFDAGGSCLLQVTFDRERILALRPETRSLPGAEFCRSFAVSLDEEGRTLPDGTSRE